MSRGTFFKLLMSVAMSLKTTIAVEAQIDLNVVCPTMCPPTNSTVSTDYAAKQNFTFVEIHPCKRCSELELDCTNAFMNFVCPQLYPSTLQYATLSFNNFGPTLPKGIFDNLTSLVRLDLRQNYLIDVFGDTDFKAFGRLETLILSNNPLKVFPKSMMNNLQQLRVLRMAEAFIEYVEPDAFGQNPHHFLEELDLRSNQLQRVPFEALEKLPELRELDLGYNKIQAITEVQRGQPIKYFKFKHLQTLYLDHNDIELVDENTFAFLPALKTLNLAHNPRLVYIDPNAFGYAAYSRPHEFPVAPGLTNYVASAELELTHLHLQGNNLKRLHPAMLLWENLLEFDFRNNPLACDCTMSWTLDVWLGKHTASYPTEIICNYPNHLASRPLFTLAPEEMQCSQIPDHEERRFVMGDGPRNYRRHLHHIATGYAVLLILVATVAGVFFTYGDRFRQHYRDQGKRSVSCGRAGSRPCRARYAASGENEQNASCDDEGQVADAENHVEHSGNEQMETIVRFEKIDESVFGNNAAAKNLYVRIGDNNVPHVHAEEAHV